MSTEHDVTHIVRSWLEEGATALPDRVLDAVLDQVPTTSQRRPRWLVWRLNDMSTAFKVAIAGFAVLVIAVAGINLMPGQSAVGGPGPSPTPSATASPAPSPFLIELHAQVLVAGSYVFKPFAQAGSDACFVPPQSGCIDTAIDDSIRVTLTVPDGWTGATGSFIRPVRERLFPVDSGVSPADADPSAADGASLVFLRGASLSNDPCRTDRMADLPPEIPVGPTVDDFADAVAAHPLLDVTTPTDVTLAGYSGKYLELQVPAAISWCGVYRPWEPYHAQGPGERWHLWVIDVDGVRVVVQSMDHAGTSAQHRAELQAIVDSIKLQP